MALTDSLILIKDGNAIIKTLQSYTLAGKEVPGHAPVIGAGVVPSVGSGAADGGTQRLIHATDDPVVTGIASLTTATTGAGVVTIRPTITVSATPDYAAGDVVGGILTLSSVVTVSGQPARLVGLTITDKSGQAPALTLMFFNATPAGGTYTDNAALVFHANDAAKRIATITIDPDGFYTVGGVSSITYSQAELNQAHKPAATDLFVLVIADDVWNAASTSDLIIEFVYQR